MSPGARPRVVALVAAHNEAGRIGPVVRALCSLGRLEEVVVVADGSTDGTAEEARAAGARVLASPRRRGKGGALDAALNRVAAADVYVFVDGDVEETASEAETLLQEVLSGRLDLAIGSLPPLPGGGFGMVKRFSRSLIRAVTGFETSEPLSGQRALTRRALDGCRPLAPGFGVESAMTIDAVRLGFEVGEVPVSMRHRPTGRGLAGFLHRGRQGIDIARACLPRLTGLR
jgi:glycosyltransferase involved in cell wall biosynthesis